MPWYDERAGIKSEDVVGWVVVYDDGSHNTSLDTDVPSLRTNGVQVFQIYYKRNDGKPGFFRATYTGRDEYPVPLSDVVLRGDWASMQGYADALALATKSWWPGLFRG